MWLLHNGIGFFLSECFLTVVVPPLSKSKQIPGVDDPYQRDEEGIKKEHDILLVDQSVFLSVNIVKK